MALFDLPQKELHTYTGSGAEPFDFDALWNRTIVEARTYDRPPVVTPMESDLTTVDVYDVRFPGFGGQSIAVWLRVPRGISGPLPAVAEYVGYGGGRGYPEESLLWASSGFAHFQMDTRGQGSVWSVGDTGDEGPTGPTHPGVMPRGILDRETYYYRRLITDAVRAVDTARPLPQVDPAHVSVVGQSQGGGLPLPSRWEEVTRAVGNPGPPANRLKICSQACHLGLGHGCTRPYPLSAQTRRRAASSSD